MTCTHHKNQIIKSLSKSNGAEAAAGRDRRKCFGDKRTVWTREVSDSPKSININTLNRIDNIVPGPARDYEDASKHFHLPLPEAAPAPLDFAKLLYI